jgi:hypothetical protein
VADGSGHETRHEVMVGNPGYCDVLIGHGADPQGVTTKSKTAAVLLEK